MLFAIAGSQGSGKTTTLNALSYPIVERKTSRSILSDWRVTLEQVNSDYDLTIRFQNEILKRKWNDDLAFVGNPPFGSASFTERTFTDLLIYATITLGKNNSFDRWLTEYGEECISKNNIYTHIFYLKAGHFQPEQDGTRGHNIFYSEMVDATMLHFYQKFTTPSNRLTIIDTPSLDKRVKTIEDIVNNYTNTKVF